MINIDNRKRAKGRSDIGDGAASPGNCSFLLPRESLAHSPQIPGERGGDPTKGCLHREVRVREDRCFSVSVAQGRIIISWRVGPMQVVKNWEYIIP